MEVGSAAKDFFITSPHCFVFNILINFNTVKENSARFSLLSFSKFMSKSNHKESIQMA